MKNILYKIFYILIILCSPAISLAVSETTIGGQLSAEISPKDPGPFTNTYIHLISYSVDLRRSNITWTINGKRQKEGIGQTDLEFTTGPVGKKVLIEIEVFSQDGRRITKEILMIPADVELLWQSDGYVPPFYRGKSLPASGNSIKLFAMPNFITEGGAKIDPLKLFYTWRANSSVVVSGYGLSSAITDVQNSFSENTYSVDVSTLDGTLQTSKIIRMRSSDPSLILYETSPLSGTLYERSLLGTTQMNDSEMTIKVEPYSFNTKNVSYKWGLNNEIPSAEQSTNQITIRQPSGTGESLLKITASSPLQSAQKSIKIEYGSRAFSF